MERQRLRLHERIVLFVMIATLSTIAVITFSEKSKHAQENSNVLFVKVVGAVVEEKVIKVTHGATVADALSYVRPTDSADLQKLAYDLSLVKDEVLIIPKKGTLSVYVKGGVEKEELLTLDEGATFLDLRKKVRLQNRADKKSFFRKRRKLKQGETITIAFQQ